MIALRLLSAALLVSALCSCRKSAPPAAPEPGATTPPDHAEEKSHDALPKLVKLSREVTEAAQVRVAPVRRGRLAETVDLSGQLVANPDATALVGARTAGRVTRVLVREGDWVRAGETLVIVTSPEVGKLRADLAAVTARGASTQHNAARLRQLFAERLGSEQEARGAEAEATAGAAEREQLVRALRGLGAAADAGDDPSTLALASPVAGTVVQLDAVRGQVVDPARTLAVVTDLSRLWFQAQLFEKDLGRVEEGAASEVRLNAFGDRVLTAKVARISGQVDPQARTVTARLTLTGTGVPLRVGLFGTARISVHAGEGAQALLVPLSALADLGDQKAVFVQQRDGDYQVHEVRLGASAGGEIAVLSGLDEGEQVVVSGVHTLKSVVLKGSMSEEE